MTDGRGCPVRDNMLVERTNPTTNRCPVRDKIWIEHVAYLTARTCSRRYSISTNISSLTGCCPVITPDESRPTISAKDRRSYSNQHRATSDENRPTISSQDRRSYSNQHRVTPDESRPTHTMKAESLEATSFDVFRPFEISPLQGFPFMRIPYHRALPDAYDTRSSTLFASQ